MFPESTEKEIEIANQIASSEDLYEYVEKKCLDKYNRINKTNITNLTETNIRARINALLREKIRIAFSGLSESNENRLQLKAANEGEDQPKICYMCGSECSNPHVEHVIRILLLYLLTYHLPPNDRVKQESLRYSHATCNVDAKGITSLFDMVVEPDGVIRLNPVEITDIGENIKSATSSRTTNKSRRLMPKDYFNPPRPDVEEINTRHLTIRQLDLNISTVTADIASAFNGRVTAHDVVNNLNKLINAIVLSVSDHFDSIIRLASRGHEYSTNSTNKKRKAKGIKKRNKKTKKQRSKRT